MWSIKQFQCHMSISDKSSVIYFRCSSFPRVFAPKQDSFPMMSIKHAIHWLYPHTILLGHEGKMAVEDVLKVSACFTSFPSSTSPSLPSPSLPISSFPFLSLSFSLPAPPSLLSYFSLPIFLPFPRLPLLLQAWRRGRPADRGGKHTAGCSVREIGYIEQICESVGQMSDYMEDNKSYASHRWRRNV